MPRHRVVSARRRGGLLLATVAAVVVAACSSGGRAVPSTSSSSSTSTSTTVAPGDLELVIGTVLPTGGSVPDLGASLAAGVQLAVNQINAAGGVFERPLRVVNRSEGDSPASALLAVQGLLVKGLETPVNAIVGPASSVNLLSTLSVAVHAGVITCSPTASALSLDQFPDAGLFFRTVPSDSLQAAALARSVRASGANSVAVVYLDDAYGRPFAKAVERQMRSPSLTVGPTVAISGTDASIADAVATVTDAHPSAVVVIADAVSGPTLIQALDGAASSAMQFYVNDAMRHPDASVPPFSAELGKRVHGESPLAYSTNAKFLADIHAIDPSAQGLYAAKAYDCVNLIALAAQVTNKNSGTAIAGEIPGLSSDGAPCETFEACKDLLANGLNADYDGPDDVLAIDANGNPSQAMFEPFTFDSNGRDVGGTPRPFP